MPDEDTTNGEKVTVPPILYQYCGAEALKGIIESRALWLCSVSSMNDYMEHNWLVEIARHIVQSRRPRILDRPNPFYNALSEMFSGPAMVGSFAACFSSNGDLLSQWRAYAGNGGGFAVGIHSQSLRKQLSVPKVDHAIDDNIGLSFVVYEEEIQEQFVVGAIDKHGAQAGNNEHTARSAALGCYNEILRLALISKNPAFSEEQEWRIIYVLLNDFGKRETPPELRGPKFRCRGDQIVPYYELPLADPGQCPIAEIVFGPKNRDNGNLDAVKRLLVVNGFDASKINFRWSKATYR